MVHLKVIFLFGILTLITCWAAQVNYSGQKTKFNNKEKKIDLIGKAKVVDKDNTLTADRIELYNKDEIAIATGNVRLVNVKDQITYTGEQLTYDYGVGKVRCDSRAKIINEKDKVFIEADKMISYLKTNIAEAISNVHLNHYKDEKEPVTIFGDYGIYQSEISLASLFGNTKIFTSNSYSYSDNLHYYNKEKRVLLVSNVHIESYEKDGTNDIKAELVDYRFLSNEVFYCFTNVELHDNKDSNIIYSQVLEYYPDTKYTYVTGSPQLVNQKKEIVVNGDIFERFEFEDILYIKGDAKIVSREQQANSSMAVYWIKTKEVLLYGAPFITMENDSVLFAEKIRFNVERQLFRMEGQILGNLGN